MQWGTPVFGNVTALKGLHVIREIQELKYDARMRPVAAPPLAS